MTITKTYSYDKKFRVTKETVTDSRDIEHFTKYTYPDKVSGANMQGSSYYGLIQTNRIGRPVETLIGHTKDKKEYITGGKVDIYTGTGKPRLYRTLSLSLTNPLSVSDYKKVIVNSRRQAEYDSHYKLDVEYSFDDMFRLLSIKPFGQMETKYTWDGIYPTSKTIGNQTWKYSFFPYVGVKEIVDPRGIITKYEYDCDGRLIKESQIVNNEEQILNVYQYHIQSEE